jgi:hypothetical protein
VHALLVVSRLTIVAELGAIVALVESGAVFGAVIAGVFMLANTLLTVYLTTRLSSRRDEAPKWTRRRR